MKNILITGGAGFIGSHVCRLFVNKYPEYRIINYDALTYAGNLENLKDIEDKENYAFVKGDITDYTFLKDTFEIFKITDVIHLAAESHVDKSIENPNDFVNTNVLGTVNLLNVAKEYWKDDYENHRFHHVSTDEVYGSLDSIYPDSVEMAVPRLKEGDIKQYRRIFGENLFTERTEYSPHSPYSASKAASDHFVRAYHDTYGLNVTISNCSNNYGPNQFPEKLVPLVINNLINFQPIPVYGTGENVRDWIYVEDHAKAIDLIFHKGRNGQTYNVGGMCEIANIDLVRSIVYHYAHERAYMIMMERNRAGKEIVDENYHKVEEYLGLITNVEDRKGHDLRYSIDCSKIMTELKWEPEIGYFNGMKNTVNWYINNEEWLKHIETGEYKNYYRKKYDNV